MKKITQKIFFIIIILFTTNIVVSKNLLTQKNEKINKNNIYVGQKLGWSKFKDIENISPDFKGRTNIIKNNKLSASYFIGYKKNKYLSFEIGNNLLGTAYEYGKFINKKFNSKGINLSTKINFPIYNDLYLYTKIGNILVKSTSTKENKIKNNIKEIQNIKFSPLFSLGIENKIRDNVYYSIDYQWIFNIGDKKILNEEPSDVSWNFNLIYKNIFNNEKSLIHKNKINKKDNPIININLLSKKTKINYKTLNIIKKIIKRIGIYKIKSITLNHYLVRKINNYPNILKHLNTIKNIEKRIYFKKINKKIIDVTNILINKKWKNKKKYQHIISKIDNKISINIKIY